MIIEEMKNFNFISRYAFSILNFFSEKFNNFLRNLLLARRRDNISLEFNILQLLKIKKF